jgi:general secretion pathway protein G
MVQKEKGYTLIELLIVLVIMGMLMGLTTPRLVQMYDSVVFSLERDEIVFQLGGLPFSVYQRGERFSILSIGNESGPPLLVLPSGWHLNHSQTTDVVYSPLGYCSGGEAVFKKGERELIIQLDPPMCLPVIL